MGFTLLDSLEVKSLKKKTLTVFCVKITKKEITNITKKLIDFRIAHVFTGNAVGTWRMSQSKLWRCRDVTEHHISNKFAYYDQNVNGITLLFNLFELYLDAFY